VDAIRRIDRGLDLMGECYPANLPSERLAGLQRIKMPDGRWLPAVHHAAFRDLYPESTGMLPQTLHVTSKGLDCYLM
jgi:hypothetical protein